MKPWPVQFRLVDDLDGNGIVAQKMPSRWGKSSHDNSRNAGRDGQSEIRTYAFVCMPRMHFSPVVISRVSNEKNLERVAAQ